jgi:hypothetical protein
MLLAEKRRDDAIAALNRQPWPGSRPVTWQDFPEPNPWPLLVQGNDKLPDHAPLAARLASAVHSLPASTNPNVIRWTHQSDPRDQGWTLWLAEASRLVKTDTSLGAVGPQGRLHRRLPVAPGEVLEIAVVVDSATAAQPGNALLTVRFTTPAAAPSPPRPPPPLLLRARQSSIPTPSQTRAALSPSPSASSGVTTFSSCPSPRARFPKPKSRFPLSTDCPVSIQSP